MGPPNVAGKQKTCTLTCPDGEVPANGLTEAICQRVRDGEADQVDKWTQRITKCVPADDLLANLSAPPASNPNAPEKTSEANKEGSKVTIINTSSFDDPNEEKGAGHGHSHKKKKNKGDKKKDKKKEKALRQEARGY